MILLFNLLTKYVMEKNLEKTLIKGCETIKQSKPIKDELNFLLTNQKTKMKKTISKSFIALVVFVVSCLGMLSYASYYAMQQENINTSKMETIKSNNFNMQNIQNTTEALKGDTLVAKVNSNISLTHTYLHSSFDLLPQKDLNSLFAGYTTTIYPIRVKLERFMQDIQGKYFDDNDTVKVVSDGGFYIFRNGKRIWETIPIEEYSFNKNDTITFIAKDIYKPIAISTAHRKTGGNSFRGVLEFKNGTIINELDIEQYIRGIGESASWTAPEKMKAQAILARSYAYFYMYSGFKKFKDVDYILTDNPANSQKYVGASVTNGDAWQNAVKTTIGEILVDKKWELFIAPYSTCSFKQEDGKVRRKTLSEARWGEKKIVVDWKTKLKFGNEVLQPVDDSFGECKEKQSGGHGVGLSGNGAEYMASKLGKKFDEIIKYYYKGVEIKNIFK